MDLRKPSMRKDWKMATSNFDKWEQERIERERMRTREACGHLKDQALAMSLEAPESNDGWNFAHYFQKNVERAFDKNGFPQRLINVSFQSFNVRSEQDEKIKSRLVSYCEGMLTANRVSFQSSDTTRIGVPSFAMYGPPGTGKTFAAVCVIKEALWLGHSCMYTTVSSLAREVRSTFRKGSAESEEDILEKYAKAPVLVMDEIGAGTGSDHERAMFTDVISERYNAKRPTILISNLNLKDFKEALGERVTDRMSEDGGFILPVLGESRRRA